MSFIYKALSFPVFMRNSPVQSPSKHHIYFWTGYIIWDLLQAVVSMKVTSVNKLLTELMSAMGSTLLTLPIKITLFYYLLHFTLKPLLQKKKQIRIPVTNAVVSTLITLFMLRAVMIFIVFPYIYHVDRSALSFFRPSSLIITLFDLIIPSCLLIIYELYSYTKTSRERESKMEKEKLISELNFLKAQINPHFLFNVLSTVHALSRNKAPEAADVTLKLSQLMRFMLFDARRKEITIAEEVKILEDYIELEKVRFSSKLTVSFKKLVDDESQKIAPLVLLPFVENAFKHGSSESILNSFVNISLIVNKGNLNFEVENSMEESLQNNTGTQIGLANIKRQLELIYPGHGLKFEKRDKTFCIALNLDLSEHEEN